ncbi:MAG: Holliday junction resolvase Hjc [Candidatus Woesearchaeota archaeon]
MSRKSKGLNAERELIHLFWKNEWSACRVAGSGSIKYPSPDVIAGKQNRKIVIECKSTKDESKYLTIDEVEQLKEFANIFGAEPWIGVKFSSKWWFFNPEDLRKTKNSYTINSKDVVNKGLLFNDMIK